MNFNYENLNLVHSENQDDFASPKSLNKILESNKNQWSSTSKTESIPSILDLRHQDIPTNLVQLHLGVGGQSYLV